MYAVKSLQCRRKTSSIEFVAKKNKNLNDPAALLVWQTELKDSKVAIYHQTYVCLWFNALFSIFLTFSTGKRVEHTIWRVASLLCEHRQIKSLKMQRSMAGCVSENVRAQMNKEKRVCWVLFFKEGLGGVVRVQHRTEELFGRIDKQNVWLVC